MLPENAATVRLFLQVSGQWRRAGLEGAPVALDYGAVEAVLRMLGTAPGERRRLFEGLRVMEAAALPLLRKRTAR